MLNTAEIPLINFPENYPEMIEQMGQIINRELIIGGLKQADAHTHAFKIAEAIRTEIGGEQAYIPRGLLYELSKRDEEIYNEFRGDNYDKLAHKYKLTSMQVRTIIKRGQARDRAARQASLI